MLACAVVSLALVWIIVRLLARSGFAATVATAIFFCYPAYRACLLHPSKRNLLLLGALAALALVLGAWRFLRRNRPQEDTDKFHLARKLAALGVGLLGLASLSVPDYLNVYISAALAAAVGITFGYWWKHRSGLIAKIAFWLLAVVFSFFCILELTTADWQEGQYLAKMGAAIVDEMGDRDWIVTDGSLEDEILAAAKLKGRDIHVISLVKDSNAEYRKQLAELVREKKLGGAESENLALSLDLGVLQFVQDWFRSDPEIAKKCVVFSAPDLWYSADITPVPEVLFFGGDPARKVDWNRWPEFDKILHAPKMWGSYRLGKVRNPYVQTRLNLRRHLGHVANDRGVWLQDAKRDDEAFALYRLVTEEIDRDNVSAMFNVLGMAGAKYGPAVTLSKDIGERMKRIVEDKSRRYILGALSRFYGYIRNPDMFVRLGYQWARSGVPGTALAQIRRAIDLVPSDRQRSLMNMLASLYADSNDAEKSRRAYREVLEADSENHAALMGMVRLALLDGDQKTALEYLERATASGGDDPRIDVERAMVAMMKNDFAGARDILRRRVDADASDVRALSMYASVVMQLADLEKDAAKKKAFEKELETVVLPALTARAGGELDYYANTVKAFLLLRKGEKHRREARDAFALAAKARPGVAVTQDMVLGLDISLDDRENAEYHARDVLKYNRKAPLANYVMGSIALGKGDLKSAELYLKRAADAEKPVDLALNDLAETYRQLGRPEDAVAYAEKAIAANPRLYVAKATLASALMDSKRELPRALALMNEAIEASKVDGRVEDFRMYIELARAQLLNGDKTAARMSLRKMKSQAGKLSPFEKKGYEELLESVK